MVKYLELFSHAEDNDFVWGFIAHLSLSRGQWRYPVIEHTHISFIDQIC
jgi:hypothetical protein